MIHLLSREEQDRLHQRYRENDLFRHWAPFLMQLELEQDEIDISTLWWQIEKEVDILRLTKHHRDEMIFYLFKQMREDFKTVKNEGGTTIVRTAQQAELTAVTVMCVIMTMLLNAVEPGHEDEDFDNMPICVAIANLLRNHPHFTLLMDRFFNRKVDNRGNKIVIKPSDPMKENAMFENVPEDEELGNNQETGLSEARQSKLDEIIEIFKNGNWKQPATEDNIEQLLNAIFGKDVSLLDEEDVLKCEDVWDFFENGRTGNSRRLEVATANLAGYFCKENLLIGTPTTINVDLFGNNSMISSFNKGYRQECSQKFSVIIPFIEKYIIKIIRKG